VFLEGAKWENSTNFKPSCNILSSVAVKCHSHIKGRIWAKGVRDWRGEKFGPKTQEVTKDGRELPNEKILEFYPPPPPKVTRMV
jgi:hypothetical protein